MARNYEATDRRDKLYAMLAFDMEAARPVSRPNYTIDAIALFKDVTVHYVTKEKNLDILSFVHHNADFDQLRSPTWVHTWTDGPLAPFPLTRFEDTPFRATKSLGVRCQEGPEADQMTIAAICRDNIDLKIEPISEPSHRDRANIDTLGMTYPEHRKRLLWVEDCERVFKEIKGIYDKDVVVSQELWRTLICGMTGMSDIPGDDFQEIFAAYRTMMKALWGGTEIPKVSDGLGRYGYSNDDIPEIIHRASLFEAEANRRMEAHAFCSTVMGRVGMFPPATKHGDIICYFLGGKTPYVIRPNGSGEYFFVGNCYVYGMMDGEILDEPDWERSIEDIVLV